MPVYLGKKQQKSKETQSEKKVEKFQSSQEEYIQQVAPSWPILPS